MTMGENIRRLRREKDLTQDELGQKLDPPVNRAAINKWEKGRVENIKRNHIEQMANLFNVRPSELMCFAPIPEPRPSNTESDQLKRLMIYAEKLNELGMEKILNECEDMVNLPKYTK